MLQGLTDNGSANTRGRVLMKVVIQVANDDDAKAWAILQRHSPGVAFPNRTFVINEEAMAALREAGVRFVMLSDDARIFSEEGVASGERI
jgi:hypothetical protein